MSSVFKVISGKNNLNIIVVTQNYFQQGKYSRDIRNSCNYVCLFRNCGDSSLNCRVAQCLGLRKAYEAAERHSMENDIYPYFFCDQTQRAQLSTFRLYTNIISPIRTCYSIFGMRGYIVNESDFRRKFQTLRDTGKSVVATEHEDAEKPVQKSIAGANGEKKKRKSSREIARRKQIKKKRLEKFS